MHPFFQPASDVSAVRTRIAGVLLLLNALVYCALGLGQPVEWLVVTGVVMDLVIGVALLGDLRALRSLALLWLVLRMVVWLAVGLRMDLFGLLVITGPQAVLSVGLLFLLSTRPRRWVMFLAVVGSLAVACLGLLLIQLASAMAH